MNVNGEGDLGIYRAYDLNGYVTEGRQCSVTDNVVNVSMSDGPRHPLGGWVGINTTGGTTDQSTTGSRSKVKSQRKEPGKDRGHQNPYEWTLYPRLHLYMYVLKMTPHENPSYGYFFSFS